MNRASNRYILFLKFYNILPKNFVPDLIFANKVSNKFNPFGNDFNEITMITKETKESWKKMNKKDVAEKIIKKAFMYLD